MLTFAYDGSIHGDWLFRYALHLARHEASRTIHLGAPLIRAVDSLRKRIALHLESRATRESAGAGVSLPHPGR